MSFSKVNELPLNSDDPGKYLFEIVPRKMIRHLLTFEEPQLQQETTAGAFIGSTAKKKVVLDEKCSQHLAMDY